MEEYKSTIKELSGCSKATVAVGGLIATLIVIVLGFMYIWSPLGLYVFMSSVGNKRKYIIAYMAFISATLLKLLLNVEL